MNTNIDTLDLDVGADLIINAYEYEYRYKFNLDIKTKVVHISNNVLNLS